ncbi:hypothetical protein LAD77_00735 [Klebsiella pneumoniae]|nr:hypothetical protein [Klebsiella pneumoniae]
MPLGFTRAGAGKTAFKGRGLADSLPPTAMLVGEFTEPLEFTFHLHLRRCWFARYACWRGLWRTADVHLGGW